MSKEERIHFLLHTHIGAFIVNLMELLAPAVGMLVVMFLIWSAETRFFPVVTDWSLDSVELVDGNLVLGGSMKKTRPCDLVATSVVATPKTPFAPRVLIYQLKPHEIMGGNAPTGRTTWGPWTVRVPEKLTQHRDQIAYLEVIGHHHCHALWHQETVYGRVEMSRLPI